MAKKDFGSSIDVAIRENITPAAALFRRENSKMDELEIKAKVATNKKMGSPTKNPNDRKTEEKKIYFSPNDIAAIEKAGIKMEDLATILRMKLREMGADVGLR